MGRLTVRDGVVVSSNVGSVVKGGTFTITAGNLSTTVTHGLGAIPTWAIAGSSEEYPAVLPSVSAKTNTTLTISIKEIQLTNVTGYYACST